MSAQSSGVTTTYNLQNFNIMLVEDYNFTQQVITGMLKSFGVGSVTVCSSGEEAKRMLSVLSRSSNVAMKMPDIILTDWLMPEGDGPDLIKWIREHEDEKVKFLPVIMISAFASVDIVMTSRDGGANEALVKPVSGSSLASRILSVINNPRPFIKSPDFFGPDRRRKEHPYAGKDKRVTPAEEIKVNNEQA